MKTKKTGNHIFLIVISIINLLWFAGPLYTQEEPLRAFKWYFCPRAYPFDTIPGGAFKNAVDQREALLQSTGYQFPGTSWQEIGPKPFGYGLGSSGRIHHVVYDPRDPEREGKYIYVTGASGGLWKTENGGVNWVNISGNDPLTDLPSLSAPVSPSPVSQYHQYQVLLL